LGVPVRSLDGEIIGVLQGSLSLAGLSQYLQTVPIGSQGYLELLAGDGTTIAHPDRSRLLQKAGIPDGAASLAATGQSASLEVRNADGDAIFAAAAPVADLGWIVHVQVPVGEALAPLWQRLLRATAVALVTLIIATTLGALVARRLTAPIGLLRAAARRIERGEQEPLLLHGPLAVPIQSGDELEELARDLESMARRLGESEARYRAVSELTSDFAYAYTVRSDGTLAPEWTTEAFARITGFTIEEVAARGGWRAFIHPDDRVIGDRRRETIFAGHPAVNEFRIITKAGESRVLRIHARPVWDETEGRIVRIYGAGQDVTERRQAEEELIQARAETSAAQRAESLKTDLISMVSHELRTPLTALQGFSELLLARQPAEAERQLWTRTINEESQRLAEIVDDLLQVSRIEAGAIEPHLEPIPVGVVIREVMTTFAAQPGQHHFEVNDSGEDVIALADHVRLHQILKNLISNAVKYSPEGGPIRISLAQQDQRAVVAVSDEGLGVPPDDLPKLFTRFHRVNASDRTPVRGTGLGLYITRQLVELQGGTIEVESRLGEGSTFTFTLPLADRKTIHHGGTESQR
ncbi:MAG TPA: ATP-binding protein, partial [Gemmatimonadales bacterium]|nr:ATP-binding protein [Gemmatimonadales bacterium]